MTKLVHLVAERVRVQRRRRALTQEALAERVGVTPESISNIERGVHPPALETLDRILEALAITPAEFFASDFRAGNSDER